MEWRLCFAACACGQLAAPALATQAEEVPPEAIVVTGERANRTLRETPSSVAVFTGTMLDKVPGSDRLDQILELVPNVTFGTGGGGPTIRGQDSTGSLQDLPAFLGGNRPRVTLQVDGRAVGFNEFVFGALPLWDVGQVEVYRSPQSTTQGRNSIAGAIFVSTKDPTFAWEGGARAIAASRRTRHLSGFVSGPLVADQLAFRIAGDWRRGRTASRITDLMPGANPNDDNFALLRAKLLAEPSDLPNLRFEMGYTHTESSSPQVERVTAPFRDRRDPLPGYGVFKTDIDSVTATVDWAATGSLSLQSTVSHGWTSISRYPRPGLGEADNRGRDLSVETVARWQPSSTSRLIAGVHHLRTRLDQSIDVTAVLGLGEFDDRQRSTGVFGDLSIEPLPRLTVAGGLRYQSDSQRRLGQIGNPAFLLPVDFDETYTAWLPKLSLAYDFSPDLRAGLLVQRSYNPGGVTLNFATGEQDVFGPERLWSYELFARAKALGGRLRIATNLFYNDIRGSQRATFFPYSVPGGGTAFWAEIDNLPKAESYGLEASAEWQATSRLLARAGLGLLKTRIIRSVPSRSQLQGNDFGRAPALTAHASADWTPFRRLQLNAAVRHSSTYFSDDANAPTRKIGRATRIDARAAFDAGPVILSAYVRNLLDDFNMTYLFSSFAGVAMEPRQIGIALETRF